MAKFREKLNDILVSVSWGELCVNNFGKNPKWLYEKLELDIGSEDGFTKEELLQFKRALYDLADRIRRCADSL